MDKLTMIERVVKAMGAKETRTVIMICNDRLAELGEPVHQMAKNKSRGFRKQRPYYCKEIPDPCPDSIKNFHAVDTEWVNDIEKYAKPCLLSTRDQQRKAIYMVVVHEAGTDLTLPNGCLIPNCKMLSQAGSVFDAVALHNVGSAA